VSVLPFQVHQKVIDEDVILRKNVLLLPLGGGPKPGLINLQFPCRPLWKDNA
jgi:hypothetical protein